jgi:hypothetical protein
MAKMAILEVQMDVRVSVVLAAENATEDELARLVARDSEGVKGGILAALERAGAFEKSAGWLDDSREVFVTEVMSADAQGGNVPEVVR